MQPGFMDMHNSLGTGQTIETHKSKKTVTSSFVTTHNLKVNGSDQERLLPITYVL